MISKLLNLMDTFLFSSYLTACKELEILNIGISRDEHGHLSDLVHLLGFKCHTVSVYLEPQP